MQKLKSEYMPLGMAVFLAIGGLLGGMLWKSTFSSIPAGTTQIDRVSGANSFISQADGAQIDSAAFIPESAPFVASADVGSSMTPAAAVGDAAYEAAVKDPEQPIKTTTTAPASPSIQLASGIVYKVVNGDTMSSISAMFGVPINTIEEFNPSVNFSALTAGISITIPSVQDVSSFAG